MIDAVVAVDNVLLARSHAVRSVLNDKHSSDENQTIINESNISHNGKSPE